LCGHADPTNTEVSDETHHPKANTAVLVIDVQNDFKEGGALAIADARYNLRTAGVDIVEH